MISCWSVGEECQDPAKSHLGKDVNILLILFKLTISLKSLLIFGEGLVKEVNGVACFLSAKHHNRITATGSNTKMTTNGNRSVLMDFQGLDLSCQLVDEHCVVVAVEVNVVQQLLLAHIAPICHRKLHLQERYQNL